MKKYKVVPLDAAYQDIDKILSYIRNELANEFAADKYAKLFEAELQNLGYFAYGRPVLENLGDRYKGIRMAHVKKFVIFYIVNEEKSEVVVLRVAHGMTNWQTLFEK